MELQNKLKVWWCDRCKHYISGNYKECPYCKVLEKEAKEMNEIVKRWKKQRSMIALNNLKKIDKSRKIKGVDKWA